MHCQTHIQDIIVDCRDQQGDGGGGHGSGEQACKHLSPSSSITLLLHVSQCMG